MAADDDLDLDEIRATLLARREEAGGRVAALAAPKEKGSAQGFGKRIGDGTIEAVSRLTEIGVGRALEDGLARTERALAKLDDGTYGCCDRCGGEIPVGRLRALPESVLCVRCASATAAPRPRSRR